ncbi:hypothetical protein P4388_10900 [Bacillus thuringiensis]|uniref:hypothetical protein n=1 Tax=Bacillus cereus group TaxID=86661 RepID=UPI000A3C1DCC|nr:MULTISPECIES: hypothetical protein [Bacillus cereus group]MED3349123.1 hypothetical protein [Bacillus thuringiensis]MDA2111795.1 hypothetical protein [Bacillus cereus]MDA2129133.1 hypothetical protein [Bacillus cereus]MDA2151472.1 hypothetical protein [Bacillus cereus]MDA2524496.1 hypothetical protein [Bacillus cereus]
MNRILNCIDMEHTFDSISSILDVPTDQVISFLKENKWRISNDEGFWRYDNLDFNDIQQYFNFDIKTCLFDEIVINHIAAILDQNSFFKEGLLNLKGLIKQKNCFTEFLNNYGITMMLDDSNNITWFHNKKQITSSYLEHRLTKDRCINGFLFGDEAQHDSNIRDIKECPEIIKHISDVILQDSQIARNWIEQAQPSLISFKVKIEDIDKTTYIGAHSLNEIRMSCILDVFDFLLHKYAFCPIGRTRMIFLKEDISIPPSDIISIKILDDA